MKKIATLFERDWDGHKGVIPEFSEDARKVLGMGFVHDLVPTEKLDGTNIRLTVRAGTVVRTEKRRNPTRVQKAAGILEPWYTDTSGDDPADQYLLEAAANLPRLWGLPDGEYPAEAIGPKIQGNPLGRDRHEAWLLFAGRHGENRVPLLAGFELSLASAQREAFEYIRRYLETARSTLHPGRPVEGIVWQNPYGAHLKIKAKDFR